MGTNFFFVTILKFVVNDASSFVRRGRKDKSK